MKYVLLLPQCEGNRAAVGVMEGQSVEELQAMWSRRRWRSCSASGCTKSWSRISTWATYGLRTALSDNATPGRARGRAAALSAGQHAAADRALEVAVVARLREPAAPVTGLPRRKPLSRPRPLTRWQQVARRKGFHPKRPPLCGTR